MTANSPVVILRDDGAANVVWVTANAPMAVTCWISTAIRALVVNNPIRKRFWVGLRTPATK
jgi:hypothetical protein